MLDQTQLFAAVAGYVGKPDAAGAVGIFRRPAAAGGSWTQVLEAPECHYVMVHPANPDLVFAGTDDGVYRSTDKGTTFARTSFPDAGQQIWCIHVDPRDPKRMYAGASPIGVYLSEDEGASWRALPNPGMPERCKGPFESRVMRLAQNPANPDQIFAALEIAGAMVSNDSGESWTDCSHHLVALSEQPAYSSKIVSDTFAEGMLDGHAMAIAPAQPARPVLACRMGLFDTANQGQDWRDMQVGRYSPTTYARDIRQAPGADSTLYAALSVAAASEDGGLYRSDDAGDTWRRFDKVQVHGTIMSVGLHAHDPNQVYLGARYNGEVFGTQDGGETWTGLSIPGEVKDIYCVACG